jgi:hypothetical protein
MVSSCNERILISALHVAVAGVVFYVAYKIYTTGSVTLTGPGLAKGLFVLSAGIFGYHVYLYLSQCVDMEVAAEKTVATTGTVAVAGAAAVDQGIADTATTATQGVTAAADAVTA